MHSGGQRRQGSVIGNLRVRRGRRRQQVVQVERPEIRKPRRPGVSFLIIGFLVLIAAGTLLLMLPAASADGNRAPFMRALFTSTSAVCVTGLAVVDTRESWSVLGQVIILLLIQLGGLGFMTSSTLLLILLGRRLSLAQRLVTGEIAGRLGSETPRVLVRRIVTLALVTEAIGAAVLIVLFALDDRSLDPSVMWRGLFTAVSAFNNAGFDIEGGGVSLRRFAGNPPVLLSVAALTTMGSLGYAVVWDVGHRRGWRRLTVNSKIVLVTFAVLTAGGGLVIFLREVFREGVSSDVGLGNTLIVSFAESAYARTSGFTALDVGGTEPEILFFIAGLMFIGGGAGSTAGGIKVNTFSTLFVTIVASIRGEEHVHVFGREIPWRQVNRALSVALLSVAIVFTSTFALSLTTDANPAHVVFEAVSAFGTTGLSAGITGSLNAAGQLVLIVTMFAGRVGPLTIALALAARFQGRERLRYPEADVNIG